MPFGICSTDELNSNSKLFPYLDRSNATAILSGEDLNNYTNPGNYNSSDSVNAATLINSPYSDRGFILYVLKMGVITKQIAIPTSENKISMRTYIGSWGEWNVIQFQ